jgi:hypothetical protein
MLIALALTGMSEIAMQEEIGTHSSWVVDQSVTDTADLVDLVDLTGFALVGLALVGVAAAVERRGGIFVSGWWLIERTEPNVTCCLQVDFIARYLQIFGDHQHWRTVKIPSHQLKHHQPWTNTMTFPQPVSGLITMYHQLNH